MLQREIVRIFRLLANRPGCASEPEFRCRSSSGSPSVDSKSTLSCSVLRALAILEAAANYVEVTAKSLFTHRDAVAALCRRNRIRRLSVFGSVLRGTVRQLSQSRLHPRRQWHKVF
jgi:hypothetical protein